MRNWQILSYAAFERACAAMKLALANRDSDEYWKHMTVARRYRAISDYCNKRFQ